MIESSRENGHIKKAAETGPTADPVSMEYPALTVDPAPTADTGPTVEPAEDFKRKRNGSSKHRHFDRIQLAKVIQVSRR